MAVATESSQRPKRRAATRRRVRRRAARLTDVRTAEERHPEHVAWYVGLAVMAVFELIEWPVALIIAAGHEVAHRSRSRAIRKLAEGIEAAA